MRCRRVSISWGYICREEMCVGGEGKKAAPESQAGFVCSESRSITGKYYCSIMKESRLFSTEDI